MSDDIDLDQLFEGLAEFFGDLFGSNPTPTSTAVTAPVNPTEPQENPKYPIGSKWRVRENEWWDGVTTDDVLTIIYSTSIEVLFSHPKGGTLLVKICTIDDFEEVCDGPSAGKEVPGTSA